MKKYYTLLLLLIITIGAFAQENENITDSGTFFLHKFARNIGKETYRATKTDSGILYNINFQFTDRGQPVPLKAKMVISPTYESKLLWIKGSTSRFSTINDSIAIKGQTAYLRVDDSAYTKKLTQPAFIIAGYSPGTRFRA